MKVGGIRCSPPFPSKARTARSVGSHKLLGQTHESQDTEKRPQAALGRPKKRAPRLAELGAIVREPNAGYGTCRGGRRIRTYILQQAPRACFCSKFDVLERCWRARCGLPPFSLFGALTLVHIRATFGVRVRAKYLSSSLFSKKPHPPRKQKPTLQIRDHKGWLSWHFTAATPQKGNSQKWSSSTIHLYELSGESE